MLCVSPWGCNIASIRDTTTADGDTQPGSRDTGLHTAGDDGRLTEGNASILVTGLGD